MNSRVWQGVAVLLISGLIGWGAAWPRAATADDRVVLRFDTDEPEAVLAIVARARTGQAIQDEHWRRLFDSPGYVRLKQREAEMHRDFTDDEFKQFVLSPALAQRADSVQHTLDTWKQSDLTASARRVLAYLPDSARIRTSVFPVIKPKSNSFVFEPSTNAAIFLFLDPQQTAAQFENTVAHEMHHIGFASVSAQQAARFEDLSPNVKTTLGWMGGFGEGLAMLAAAGSADVHPHATSSPGTRARWDRDMTHFNRDLGRVEKFLLDVLDGRLENDDEIRKAGFSFFGVQGPWYTVGYRMAVVVERRFGRASLIECMLDPRVFVARYNAAAAQENRGGRERLALWSVKFSKEIGAKTSP